MQAKRVLPSWSLLTDNKGRYTPAVKTDIKETFKRVLEQQKKEKVDLCQS